MLITTWSFVSHVYTTFNTGCRQVSSDYQSNRAQIKWSGIPVKNFLAAYMTVVRPTLEYACPAWSTSLTLGLQSGLERMQRRAMNILYPDTPYIEALGHAQLSERETYTVM